MNTDINLSRTPPIVGARDVPKLRLWLLDQWQRGHLFWQVVQKSRFVRPDTDRYLPDLFEALDALPPEQRVEAYARWERGALRDADLWWVSAEMMDLLVAAAASVPDDVTVDDLPHVERNGLMVFERTWRGTAREGTPIDVDAMLWARSNLPPMTEEQLDRMESVPAWSTSCYARLNLDRGLTADELARAGVLLHELTMDAGARPGVGYRAHGEVWSLLGREDWPVGDTIGDLSLAEGVPAPQAFVEDRKMLVAFWTLIHQAGIAETTTHRADRPVVRRTQRAGLPKEAADVRVVTLRRVEHTAAAHDPDAPKREWSHRWVVNGHWRNARVGPGRTQRRLVWVHPYIKGPADADLARPEVVKAWIR